MPVYGLPKTLETLLYALLDESTVSSWQIYEDNAGKVNMRIRFAGDNTTHNQAHTVAYRRKSPAQTKRDQARAETFRTAHTSTHSVKSKATDALPGVITRQMAASERSCTPDKEIMRDHDSDTQSITLETSVTKFEQSAISPNMDISDLCPTVSPFVPRSTAAYAFGNEESLQEELVAPPLVHEDSVTVDVDSEPVNVSGEYIQDIDRCDCERCDNGGGDINQLDRCGGDHFRCDQCSVSKDSVLWICDRCRKMGAHKRHVKYMRLYTDYRFTDDGDGDDRNELIEYE